jgi:RTX calcium-binding nonapeptide repeat (4 copies)
MNKIMPLIIIFFLLTLGISPSYAFNFSEGFEAVSLNTFWTKSEESCSIGLSNAASHTGQQSIKLTSAPNAYRSCILYHIFTNTLKQAEVSVWINDTSPGEQTLYSELLLWDTSTKIPISIGIKDFSATTYAIEWRGKQPILIGNRTQGWHELKITIGSGIEKFFLDGAQVASFSDQFTLGQISLALYGFQSLPDSTVYFDDFSLTYETQSNITCNGKIANIVGTTDPDILVGTPSDDIIQGLSGNDGIDGRGGNDTICGGSGDDILLGGQGKDFLLGGSGNDTISGGTQQDNLYGGDGNDILLGKQDDDILRGESGNDQLFGGDGNDQLYGGIGVDSLNGERGDIDVCDGGKDKVADKYLAGCDFIRNFP